MSECIKYVLCSLLQSVYLWFLSLILMLGLRQSLVTDTSLNSQSKIRLIFSLALLQAPYFYCFLVFPEVLSRAEDQTPVDRRPPVVEQPEKTSIPKKCRTKVLLFVVCSRSVVISVWKAVDLQKHAWRLWTIKHHDLFCSLQSLKLWKGKQKSEYYENKSLTFYTTTKMGDFDVLSTGLAFYNVFYINYKTMNKSCLQWKKLLCLVLFLQTKVLLQDSYLVRTFSSRVYCQNQCTDKMYLLHYWYVCDVMIFSINKPEVSRLTCNIFENLHSWYFWQMVWFTVTCKDTFQAYSWAELRTLLSGPNVQPRCGWVEGQPWDWKVFMGQRCSVFYGIWESDPKMAQRQPIQVQN